MDHESSRRFAGFVARLLDRQSQQEHIGLSIGTRQGVLDYGCCGGHAYQAVIAQLRRKANGL
jgi:hypothetical protein